MIWHITWGTKNVSEKLKCIQRQVAIFVIALLALTKNLQLCFQSFCAKLVTRCLCYWMNRHSLSLKGGQTCFLLAFHAILRLILNYSFCAISSCELSVCSIFYAFYNYEISLPSSFWFTLSILWCCCFIFSSSLLLFSHVCCW